LERCLVEILERCLVEILKRCLVEILEKCLVEIPARSLDRNSEKCVRLGRNMERIYMQTFE
jgi:hypothetical protein